LKTASLTRHYVFLIVGQIIGLLCSIVLLNLYSFLILPKPNYTAQGTDKYSMPVYFGGMYFLMWDLFSGLIFLALLGPITVYFWPKSKPVLIYLAIVGQLFAFIITGLGPNILSALVIGLGASPAVIAFCRYRPGTSVS
jgi:hypothetical protein